MSNQSDVDTKEFELPETVYVRDIENRVFQTIVLHCLANIDGITLLEGTLIDNLLRRDSLERIKGIYVEQDSKKHSVSVKVEVNLLYGIPIPEKANEIQGKVSKEVTKLTGLHVSCVHVIFKNVILSDAVKKRLNPQEKQTETTEEFLDNDVEEMYPAGIAE